MIYCLVLYQKNNDMAKVENIKASKVNQSEGTWSPVVGEETDGLLSRIFKQDAEAIETVVSETIDIMRLCGDPHKEKNKDTGLVFGYVQSGKTLSFTTLTALAKDNGYHMVIVIAGISTNLVSQSYTRLQHDLEVNQNFNRKWLPINNPQDPHKNLQDKNTIKRELENWRQPNTPSKYKKTILVTVMKNTHHLRNLLEVLKQLDLNHVPTLIIDDEGDQASMNTMAGKNAKNVKIGEVLTELATSTIYKRIRDIKNQLPHHTFLQYTATPQAPLFINIVDNLSPNFIQLLTPGEKYTGGIAFFKENHFIVRNIPRNEIFSEENPITEIPDSLMEAMRIFFLGVAAGEVIGEQSGNPYNRSMMVHPSRLVDDHDNYYEWVSMTKSTWARYLLERAEDDESRKDLILSFRKSYKDLASNITDIPAFEELILELGFSIQRTAVELLNSKAGNLVDWSSNYAFILVGGQAMDRGFTVEGLTVTYMPRGKGVGNADTIQQRARFFGYKKAYIGYCRVYLDAENQHLFSEYIDHEEDMRNKLLAHKISGLHLDELKRQFVLNEMFKLTRGNILTDALERRLFGKDWLWVKAPHDTDFSISNNQKVYKGFLKKYQKQLEEHPGHEDRTEEQRHHFVELSLKKLYDDFISKLQYTRPGDSGMLISLKAVLELYLEEFPPEKSKVFIMSNQKGKSRSRGLNKKEEIKNLFQGKNPKNGSVIYPGDKQIKSRDQVSVQIHVLDIKETSLKNVIGMAVWIPLRLSKSLIRIKEKK